MGQRHQIYVVLPYKISIQKSFRNEEQVDSNVFPIHHQWLYGFTACNMLAQFLTFAKNSLEDPYSLLKTEHHYSSTDEIRSLLLGLYSLQFGIGHYHSVQEESYAQAENPLCSDNNDGITVIDLRGDQPKYCMMFLWDDGKMKKGIPLPWTAYLSRYYSNKEIRSDEDSLANYAELKKIMADFTVLSKEETRALFPKMYEEFEAGETELGFI